jgi:putative SOS response-associated peptidase YedK
MTDRSTPAMPVILDSVSSDRWLDGGTDPKELGELLVPCPSAQLTAWPVSKSVNSPANNGPELVQPAGESAAGV